MSLPAVLIRKSTGKTLKFGPWPTQDMSPAPNLDPDLQWLLRHTPFKSPDYDARIWTLVELLPDLEDMAATNTLEQLEAHPEYPEIKTYKKTYGTEKKPDTDIIRSIENAEEAANREILTYRTTEKMLLTTAGILARVNSGVQPNAKEQEMLDSLMAFDVKIWKNDEEKKRKIAQVEQGLEPDIDSGWEKLV